MLRPQSDLPGHLLTEECKRLVDVCGVDTLIAVAGVGRQRPVDTVRSALKSRVRVPMN
jgi:hypothetical protein